MPLYHGELETLIATLTEDIYRLSLTAADSDGNTVVEATDKTTGGRFIVRGEDLYNAVVELAQKVGLDLEDA